MFRYLWLLKLLVVVSFQFDQRAKYILVLISILVTQQYMLGLLIYSRFLQVFQGGSGIVLQENHKKTIKKKSTNSYKPWKSKRHTSGSYLPEFLQLVDLLGRDLTGSKLLLFWRDLHQPGQKASVLDQRLPLRAVPVDVLQAALAGTGLPEWRHKIQAKYWRFQTNQTTVKSQYFLLQVHEAIQRVMFTVRAASSISSLMHISKVVQRQQLQTL